MTYYTSQAIKLDLEGDCGAGEKVLKIPDDGEVVEKGLKARQIIAQSRGALGSSIGTPKVLPHRQYPIT